MSADLQGFRDAQVRLRQELGEDVPFFTPTTVTWPPGTPLDPESELPYDPTVQPLSSGFASAAVRGSIVIRPMGLSRRGISDDIAQTAIGKIEEGETVVIVTHSDFVEAGLAGATQMEVHGEMYEISQTEQDQLGEGPPERMLVYGRQM